MQRNTKQRSLILDVMKLEDRPLNCQEIFDASRSVLPKIGLATIYRAVKDFLDSGLVAEVNLPGDSQRYTTKVEGHFHYFLCRLCDRAFNIDGCPGNLNFQPPKNFRTEVHEVIFKGVCGGCDEPPRKS